jgi:Na+/H+ antiporter NhaA
VYVVSYLIPKLILRKKKISKLFIANMIALIFAGIGYTIAVLLEGLEFSPTKNVVIVITIVAGFLTGLSLSIAEYE